ncbi:MAG: hypothetical protein QXU74_00830 [Candidatus Aenigmatarchaeota archaeon]
MVDMQRTKKIIKGKIRPKTIFKDSFEKRDPKNLTIGCLRYLLDFNTGRKNNEGARIIVDKCSKEAIEKNRAGKMISHLFLK